MLAIAHLSGRKIERNIENSFRRALQGIRAAILAWGAVFVCSAAKGGL